MHQIIIIGAGPIGSYLAYQLAILGYKVLVLEQEQQAGDNVCCSGIISKECFEKLNLKNSISYLEISSAALIGPLGQTVHFQRGSTIAYAVDRPALNILLANRAISAGANYLFSTRVTDIQVNNDDIQIQITTVNGISLLRAQLGVMATGFNFGLAKRLGLFSSNKFTVAAQTEVTVHNCTKPEIYIDKSLSPDGFGWLIPKTHDKGLAGILCQHKPKYFFNKFQAYLQMQGKISCAVSISKYGIIPLKAIKRTCANRLLIVGEAAGQVKPTTGGGIYYGLLCADIAAHIVNKGFKKNDLSINQLSDYEKQWHKILNSELYSGYVLHCIWKKLKNKHLDLILSLIDKLEITEKISKSKDFEFDWHSKVLRRITGQIIVSLFKPE